MTQIHDVIVIGAGMAGSSMAGAMAGYGWDTVLLDRQRFPRHKVCGEFLSPEARGILNGFGLSGVVEALQPVPIDSCRLSGPLGGGLELRLPGTALGISRYALDTALHRAALASGAQVRTGTQVLAVDYTEGTGYSVTVRQQGGEETLHARAVIAAWGTNPRISPQVPMRRGRFQALRQPDYVGIKSHYTGLKLSRTTELFFFRGGYMGISPVEGDRFNVCALLRHDALPANGMDKSVLGMLKQASLRQPELRERLAAAVPVPGTQAAVAPVRLSRRLEPWGTCAHAGDAAVMIPPLCGDGMAMALRSAELCARLADRFLQGELSLDDWKRRYTVMIGQEFNGPLRWGRFLHQASELPLVPGLLLKLAKLCPPMARGLVHATRLKEQ